MSAYHVTDITNATGVSSMIYLSPEFRSTSDCRINLTSAGIHIMYRLRVSFIVRNVEKCESQNKYLDMH